MVNPRHQDPVNAADRQITWPRVPLPTSTTNSKQITGIRRQQLTVLLANVRQRATVPGHTENGV
jgi:hypothetical protein